MIPVFVIIFYLPVSWHYQASCVIFILAAITDGLDGYYARKLGQTSALGAFLDPVADKLMVAVVLVLLVEDAPSESIHMFGLSFSWSFWLALPAAVIIGREITISALREWMAELGASSKVAVSGYGKLKTICQMVALGFLIYHNDLFDIPIYSIGMVLLYIASILTLWSMILYLKAAWPQLKDS